MGRGLGNLRSYVNKQVFGKETHDSRLHVFGYEISHEEIGIGLFSKIKLATYKGRDIAVKIMDRDKMPEEFQEKYLSREIEILSDIQHQNIVRIFKIFDYSPKVYIFMELINGETLQEHLQKEGRMEEDKARFFFRQLANAIDYLHAKAIAHRDLKPENIMIHNETIVKIVDFGFAIKLGDLDDMSLQVWGLSPYTAPEVILSAYNPLAQDIWSLGALLFNMVTDTAPFSSSDVDMLLEKQIAKDICYPSNLNLSDSLVSIVNEMLEPDVTKRATIEEVNECAWLNKDCAVTTSAVEKAFPERERD